MLIKRVKISPTKSTPEVSLNPEGIIKIRGRSMNGNVTDFYKPIENWIDAYICNPADLTSIDFCLEYSNCISLMIFISLLRKFTYIRLKNKKYIINWYYEEGDEDILEQGEYISSVLDVSFNFIMISDNINIRL
jgi:hypothetical protein